MQRQLRFQWILPDNDPDELGAATSAKVAAHRMVRLTWLSVLLVLDHPPLYRDYRWRFGVSLHTFRRDKRKLRRPGMWIDAFLHGKINTMLYLEKTSHG
jgi:hypothetical protein